MNPWRTLPLLLIVSGCQQFSPVEFNQAILAPTLAIANAELGSGLSERDPVLWPLTDLFDGISNANDGYASNANEGSGSIVFSFAESVDIVGFSLWNDFGSLDSQGVAHFELIFRDGTGRQVGRVSDLQADPTLQMQGNGPDEFEFPEVRRVRTVEWVIEDNFYMGTGLLDSINLREVAFHGVASPFVKAEIKSAQLEGLTVRNAWTVEKLFDGVTMANDGYSSNAEEDSGVISFVLLNPSGITQMKLWNDFGVHTQQGIARFDLEFHDLDGDLIRRVSDLRPNPALQLQPNGPDVFEFPPIRNATSVRLIIHDNFPSEGGIFNSINVREIEFGTSHRKPAIASIAPQRPIAGQSITITGTDFGNYRNTNWINVAHQPFNDFPTILSWSDTQIVAMLDADLGASMDLSVVLEGVHSPSIEITMTSCNGPDFERFLDLENSLTSAAYDVLSIDACQNVVVGAATIAGGPRAFFQIIDENGLSLGSPVYSGHAIEWRSVSRTSDGYMLAGTSVEGALILSRVDEDGSPKTGWPIVHPYGDSFVRVQAAVVTNAQIIVVGVASELAIPSDEPTYGEVGFIVQFDLEGTVQGGDELTEDDGFGYLRALGVSEVMGGFVIVGDRRKHPTPNDFYNRESWITRLSHDGEPTNYQVLESGETLRAAVSWQDNEFLVVGESNDAGRMTLLENPSLAQIYDHAVEKAAFYDVADTRGGFLAAGTASLDGLIAQLDCAGGEDVMHQIDLGNEERFEAIVPTFQYGSLGREMGAVAVGVSRNQQLEQAIVASRHTVPSQPTEISLTVNDEPSVEVALGDTISFAMSVENASSYEFRKTSGPGPDVSMAALINQSFSNTINLTFDTDALQSCESSGCDSTTYELIASRAPRGRCETGVAQRATVTVKFALKPLAMQLVDSATSIRTKWGSFGDGPPIVAAHPTTSGKNRCLNGLGLSYGTPHVLQGLLDVVDENDPTPIAISDQAPQLLLYAADNQGDPTDLVGYALGARIVYDRPIILGDNWAPAEEWQGHWGGWHTLYEGGMAIVVPDIHDTDGVQPEGLADNWKEPPLIPPLGRVTWPFIRHPALWDIHVFFDPMGGLPIIRFALPNAGPDNPCVLIDPTLNPVGLNGCDTGTQSLNLNPFFSVADSYTPGSMIRPIHTEPKNCP